MRPEFERSLALSAHLSIDHAACVGLNNVACLTMPGGEGEERGRCSSSWAQVGVAVVLSLLTLGKVCACYACSSHPQMAFSPPALALLSCIRLEGSWATGGVKQAVSEGLRKAGLTVQRR